MNRRELIKRMREIIHEEIEGDREETHRRMDYALLMYINDDEITELFDALPKWYA